MAFNPNAELPKEIVIDEAEKDERVQFVDYVEPNRAKFLPPAKYKLWICIFVLVYLTNWLSDEAGFLEFLRFGGWLSSEFSLFLYLGLVVFVLVYATLDIMVGCLTFRCRGKEIGLGPWLKADRSRWATRKSPRNFPAQALGKVLKILEDGFGMFNVAFPHQNQRLRPRTKAATIPIGTEDDESSDDERTFECDKRDCETLLKIEHRINPSKMDEYRKWEEKISHAVFHAPGLVEHRQIGDGRPDKGPDTVDEEGVKQQVYLIFENIEYLNDWMISPERKSLIKALKPILVQPDIVKIQANRVLPDAFTELVTRQGEATPELSPKKWKVWWLTTIALFITLSRTHSFLPYYTDVWGLDDSHPRIKTLVISLISTFLNAYVLTPLLLFLFSPWLQRCPHEVDTIEPWRTLNDGIRTMRFKCLVSSFLHGGCAIAWIVKSQSR